MSFKKDELPDLPAEPHQPSSLSFQNAVLVRKSQCTVAFKASGSIIGHFFTMVNLKMLSFAILVSVHLSSSPATIQLQLL